MGMGKNFPISPWTGIAWSGDHDGASIKKPMINKPAAEGGRLPPWPRSYCSGRRGCRWRRLRSGKAISRTRTSAARSGSQGWPIMAPASPKRQGYAKVPVLEDGDDAMDASPLLPSYDESSWFAQQTWGTVHIIISVLQPIRCNQSVATRGWRTWMTAPLLPVRRLDMADCEAWQHQAAWPRGSAPVAKGNDCNLPVQSPDRFS